MVYVIGDIGNKNCRSNPLGVSIGCISIGLGIEEKGIVRPPGAWCVVVVSTSNVGCLASGEPEVVRSSAPATSECMSLRREQNLALPSPEMQMAIEEHWPH